MPLCVTEYNWVDDYLLSSEAGGERVIVNITSPVTPRPPP